MPNEDWLAITSWRSPKNIGGDRSVRYERTNVQKEISLPITAEINSMSATTIRQGKCETVTRSDPRSLHEAPRMKFGSQFCLRKVNILSAPVVLHAFCLCERLNQVDGDLDLCRRRKGFKQDKPTSGFLNFDSVWKSGAKAFQSRRGTVYKMLEFISHDMLKNFEWETSGQYA